MIGGYDWRDMMSNLSSWFSSTKQDQLRSIVKFSLILLAGIIYGSKIVGKTANRGVAL